MAPRAFSSILKVRPTSTISCFVSGVPLQPIVSGLNQGNVATLQLRLQALTHQRRNADLQSIYFTCLQQRSAVRLFQTFFFSWLLDVSWRRTIIRLGLYVSDGINHVGCASLYTKSQTGTHSLHNAS